MSLSSTETALIVRLRALGFLRLPSNLHSHTLVINILSVHLIHRLLDGLFRVKHLYNFKLTMKA